MQRPAQPLDVESQPFWSRRYDGGNVHSVQPVAHPQTRSYDITPQLLAAVADCCHPYWHNHGLFWHSASGSPAQPAACRDVLALERYYTSPSGVPVLSETFVRVALKRHCGGMLQTHCTRNSQCHSIHPLSLGDSVSSCFDLPYEGATSEDSCALPIRGAPWELLSSSCHYYRFL